MPHEKNILHYGTWALFADEFHLCTYSYKENAENAANDLTLHDKKNGRDTVYTIKAIPFINSNEA